MSGKTKGKGGKFQGVRHASFELVMAARDDGRVWSGHARYASEAAALSAFRAGYREGWRLLGIRCAFETLLRPRAGR
jgi:hypothetical protein